MPTASEAKKALGEDKPYKCPHCDYRCRAPQPLGRHITLHHSDVRRAERVSVTRKTLIEILGVMGQWLMEGKNDPAVTPAVLRALKEQDIKLRASIHLVALSLVERTHHMRVGLRAVDGEVLTRLTGPDSKVFLDTLSNSALRDYQKRLEEALQEYPELLALVDATEQRVQRPQDNAKQKAHYSGKKKAHTRKTQIIVNEHGEIRDISASVPGSVHNLELFRQSGAKERIPREVTAGGDKAYQGLDKELPDHSVVTPHKASRGHPLDEEQKRMNREYVGIRIVVEHTLSELKHFRVLADVFRHAVSLYDMVFQAVVAIVNPRIARQVAAALAAAAKALVPQQATQAAAA